MPSNMRKGWGREKISVYTTSLHGRHRLNRIQVYTVLPAKKILKMTLKDSYFVRKQCPILLAAQLYFYMAKQKKDFDLSVLNLMH